MRSGARIAFQGKVYEVRRAGARTELRETGERQQRVKQAIRRGTVRLVELVVRTEHGEHRVVGTPEHPFYVPARRAFVPMGLLTAGMALLGESGKAAEVVEVRERAASSEVFNVEVERAHTYFVCEGVDSGCELVHNECRLADARRLRPTEELGSKSQARRMSKEMGGDKGYGPFKPIDAVEVDGELYVTDGHHRRQAAIYAKQWSVPVNVRQPSSPEEAASIVRDWAATLHD